MSVADLYAAEIEVKILEATIDGVKALYEQRIAALEAAARAVLPLIQPAPHWPHWSYCQVCGVLDADLRHDRTCPIGVLAALLEPG